MENPNAILDTGNVESAVASAEEVQNLLKAMQTGQGVDPSGFTGGSALRMQSLDGTLKVVTFTEKHLKLVKEVPQRPAYSTVEEYSVESAYGEEGAFVTEMENPNEADPDLARKYAVVKYLRTLRKVSDVAGMVKNLEQPIQVQTIAGVRFLLRKLELAMFFGNATNIPVEFDGILALILANASSNVIDMRNAELEQLKIQDGAKLIADNYGSANLMFHSHGVQTGLDASVKPDQRVILPIQPEKGLMLGTIAAGVRTSFGDVAFRPDVFIKEGEVAPTSAIGTGAPLAPSITSITVAANTSAQFGVNIGTYSYGVSAVTAKGESPISTISVAIITVNTHAVIQITKNGSGDTPTAYKIYRDQTPGATNPAGLRYMRTVAYSASPQTVIDANEDIPGTSYSFLMDVDTVLDTIALKKLAPLTKLPLARVGAYIQWLQNLYVTLQITAPRKFVIFKNVKGRLVV